MQVDQKLIKRDGKLTWTEKCRRKKDQVLDNVEKRPSQNPPETRHKIIAKSAENDLFGPTI